jgi:hypothetical protein
MKFSPKKAMEELEKRSFTLIIRSGKRTEEEHLIRFDDVREVLEP